MSETRYQRKRLEVEAMRVPGRDAPEAAFNAVADWLDRSRAEWELHGPRNDGVRIEVGWLPDEPPLTKDDDWEDGGPINVCATPGDWILHIGPGRHDFEVMPHEEFDRLFDPIRAEAPDAHP